MESTDRLCAERRFGQQRHEHTQQSSISTSFQSGMRLRATHRMTSQHLTFALIRFRLQMHGYDTNGMAAMHQGNHMHHSHNGPPPDAIGHHPDSTDSYVTYLESDDSMQASP